MASAPVGDHIQQLDDGLKGDHHSYFVGIKCLDTDHCDFTKAMPQGELTLDYQYYNFLQETYIQ